MANKKYEKEDIKISSYKNVSIRYLKNKDTRRMEPIEDIIYCVCFSKALEKRSFSEATGLRRVKIELPKEKLI